ncbi:MAG TPA: ABC transporter substrate-binding protein, partial [Acetobacteraceae bacterium]|nr:ABC transporter substrate-binding protein [Acetobacteraceae bacterium]
RNSREPLDRGGWSVFYTAFGSYDFMDPSGHFPIRGNGTNAWFGWPTVPRLEELRDAWFAAPDLATQQRIAQDIQRTVMDEVPFIPCGSYISSTAMRANLVDRVEGPAIFWGIRRS